ncbi:MAG: rprX [Bacteroidetes bacterium]|nr:rprX [Bacteroidota bacterium]
MLNRALSISIIAILFLLSLQGAWLVRIIENEKTKFKNDVELILKDATNKELNSRLKSLSQNNFSVTLYNNNLSQSNVSSNTKVQTLDISKSRPYTKVTLEEALQEAYKDDFPLNLDTLSAIFSRSLAKAEKATNFKLTYISPDTTKFIEYTAFKNNILFLNSSYETIVPLTVTKDLSIKAEIFYPSSVFKGDLLTILILSLILTIFILFSIIMQTRMLYKQVSLAKLKENITHFLTHELRSPLQSSITNLEVGQMADSKTAPYFLEKTKEQLYFLNGLIENILDINKFEKRQSSLNKELFDINAAIEPHIARHNVDAKKTVTISTDITPGSEMFYGDKLHISNAIGNLIDNAIKYSNDPVNIIVSAKEDKRFYNISVEDNGIGIPKDEQSKVFEKFYRVNKREHSQKGKGFGLGLTYVMWVVKAHKGKISLTSEVGTGSKFTLSLIKNEHGKENTARG